MEKTFIALSSFVPLRFSHLQVPGKYPAAPTGFHFFAPAFLNFPAPEGAADKPAKVSDLKLPGRTGFPPGSWASFDHPARLGPFAATRFHGRQEKNLPLDVSGDAAPSLLEALHGAYGCSQELGNFLLGFLQALTKSQEFFGVHGVPFLGQKSPVMTFSLDSLYHIVLHKKTIF
jgi:hypothetical protein